MHSHHSSLFHSSTRSEDLRRRVHRQINSPSAQANRRTTIARQAGERVDDWDKLIELLATEESVRVTAVGDCVVKLCWTNQHCCQI